MLTKIHAETTEHAHWPRVVMAITDHEENGTIIPDDVALAIAAAYQSPGGIGRVLAELASTGSADVAELADDIDATRADARTWGGSNIYRVESDLRALAAWADGE